MNDPSQSCNYFVLGEALMSRTLIVIAGVVALSVGGAGRFGIFDAAYQSIHYKQPPSRPG